MAKLVGFKAIGVRGLEQLCRIDRTSLVRLRKAIPANRSSNKVAFITPAQLSIAKQPCDVHQYKT